MSMPNQELFDRVLQRIADDPNSFDMENWYRETDCGTVACAAGHTILEIGARPAVLGRSAWASECEFAGERRFIDDVAQEALGLTAGQAVRLFSAYPVRQFDEEAAPRSAEELSMRWKHVVEMGATA